jgi:hypothetical protein
MTVHDHLFVRDFPPPDVSAFCPDCREPWEHCSCELPEYPGAWLARIYPEESENVNVRKAA